MFHAASPPQAHAQAQHSTPPNALDSGHEDIVHDAQLDYYGRRLATASSDRTVRVHDVSGGAPAAVLRGHDGPVWQVAWAHPRFGSLLASASYDGRVIVWKEDAAGGWVRAKDHAAGAGVNSVAWADGDALVLAAGLADGRALVLAYDAESASWSVSSVNAHEISCNAVAWRGADRFATAGSDNAVREWRYPEMEGASEPLLGHSDWVRDVAYVGESLLSVSQDRTALLWRGGAPAPVPPPPGGFGDALWRVSVSPHAAVVGIAAGDGRVHLYRAAADGSLEYVSDVDASTPPADAS